MHKVLLYCKMKVLHLELCWLSSGRGCWVCVTVRTSAQLATSLKQTPQYLFELSFSLDQLSPESFAALKHLLS